MSFVGFGVEAEQVLKFELALVGQEAVQSIEIHRILV
jgi:hypothetical protein